MTTSFYNPTSIFHLSFVSKLHYSTHHFNTIYHSITLLTYHSFTHDHTIKELFSNQYLSTPNANDIARLIYVAQQREFPGMLGSLDCMYWKWENCLTGWAGQYAGCIGSLTVILEAIVDYDLCIWHAYFGLPGTNNNINVLEPSHPYHNLTQRISPRARYILQGKEYTMGYYLANGIYPKWRTIVPTIQDPRTPPLKYFAMRQKSCRKDVTRAFGVLQKKFIILS